MEITVSQSMVRGHARAPPSKSYTHRAILAAGYARGETRVERPLWSADTRATARAVRAFGGAVEPLSGDATAAHGSSNDSERPAALSITGFDGIPEIPRTVIDCRNSGTTTRLVTGTAACCPGLAVLTGDASLRSRPHGPLLEAIRDLGGRAESTRANGQAPLVVGGARNRTDGNGQSDGRVPIAGGSVAMPGDVSSQFLSALLMAGAVTEEGIDVSLTTELKSEPYVEITREVLEAYAIETNEPTRGLPFRAASGIEPPGTATPSQGTFRPRPTCSRRACSRVPNR